MQQRVARNNCSDGIRDSKRRMRKKRGERWDKDRRNHRRALALQFEKARRLFIRLKNEIVRVFVRGIDRKRWKVLLSFKRDERPIPFDPFDLQEVVVT